MEIKQHLRLQQTLVMTPQLQQAIKLLQLSRMELVDMVRDEMLENPILEDSVESGAEQPKKEEPMQAEASEGEAERVGETEMPVQEMPVERAEASEVKADDRSGEAVSDFDWEGYLDNQAAAAPMPSYKSNNEDLPSLESTLTRGTSLFDHLEWQLKLSHFSREEDGIAMLIIGNLTPDGYLEEPLAELAEEASVTLEAAEAVLARLQEFDPVGVAARSLEECLMIQAKHIGADDDVVVGLLQRHLPNLEKKNYQAIAKDLNQPLDEIYEAAKVVMRFDPKPGRQYTSEEPTYITPDVYIHKVGDKYFVVANDDGLPKLKISDFYRTALAGGSKAREYIQEKLRSAQWLIRSIQQRQRTIVKVTESILKFQRDFFDKGTAHLKPLIARDDEQVRPHAAGHLRAQVLLQLGHRAHRRRRPGVRGRQAQDQANHRLGEPAASALRPEDRRAAPRPEHRDRAPHGRQVPRAAAHPVEQQAQTSFLVARPCRRAGKCC